MEIQVKENQEWRTPENDRYYFMGRINKVKDGIVAVSAEDRATSEKHKFELKISFF